MSTRQTGNMRENRCGALLIEHGYEPFYSRGSRGGADIMAVKIDGLGPHLQVAVIRPNGGNVREAFLKLRAGPKIAGSRQVVAKEIRRNAWRWYWSEDGNTTESLEALLNWLAIV
jgi:hypothetical protein